MLMFGKCATSYGQSNCLTDEEIKKVRLVIHDLQVSDSLLRIEKWRVRELQNEIVGRDELFSQTRNTIFMRDQKIKMLEQQSKSYEKEAKRERRKKRFYQLSTSVGGAVLLYLVLITGR